MRIFTIDAFTSKPFEGNPAAVVFLGKRIPDAIQQKLAFEMNLSETAFLLPSENVDDPWISCSRFNLRWFTPITEIKLCGHATLASAKALFEAGNTSKELKFDTLSGCLLARKGDNGEVIMDLPSLPPSKLSPEQEKDFMPAVKEVCGSYRAKDIQLSSKLKYLMIRLDDSITRSEFESIQVDATKLQKLHNGSEFKGIILTLKGDRPHGGERDVNDHHFLSRFFAPWFGVAEDPVTGSAHSILTPYWYSHLGTKEMRCRQCSKRGGELLVKLREDGRIDVSGDSCIVVSGNVDL